jgi:crotonobetainyl-CoA:carnitine CoA-transferase CaiB-like acyl-CoA transferase
VDACLPQGGHYRALGLPYRIGGAVRPAPAAAPDCGADGDAVLAEAGYSEAEIATLRERGVIGGMP